jgi:hypothetical protein
MKNPVRIAIAISVLSVLVPALAQSINSAQPGKSGSEIRIQGVPTMTDVERDQRFFETHHPLGGDGGSAYKIQPDHSIIVFTGQLGQLNGSGGNAGNPKDVFNAWEITCDNQLLNIRGSGRVMTIPWKEVDALRKHAL